MTFVQMFTFVLIALVMLVEIIFLMCPLFVSFLVQSNSRLLHKSAC